MLVLIKTYRANTGYVTLGRRKLLRLTGLLLEWLPSSRKKDENKIWKTGHDIMKENILKIGITSTVLVSQSRAGKNAIAQCPSRNRKN